MSKRTQALTGPHDAPAEPAIYLKLTWGIVGLGVLVRIVHYLQCPSYWNDEAAVVVNVIRRGYGRLLEPLDFAQAAPPMFLWAERALFDVFGGGEWSLRSFPAVAGVLSLVLFARVARRWLSPAAACWAVALYAATDKIAQHADEVKQYSCDMFVTVLLLTAAYGPRGRQRPRRFAAAGGVAAVGIWFSFPAAFVFCGIAASFLPHLRRRGVSGWAYYLGVNAAVVASFATLYAVYLRRDVDPSLVEYWRDSFPQWGRLPVWLARQAFGLWSYPFAALGPVAVGVGVVGCVALARAGRWRPLAILLFVVTASFVAASMHRYPFVGPNRLSLYLVPVSFLVLGAGCDALFVWARFRHLLRIAPVALLSAAVAASGYHVFRPEWQSATRDVARYLRSHRADSEAMYLVGDHLDARPASGRNVELFCYWPEPGGTVVVGFRPPSEVPEPRFWVVYSLKHPETPAGSFARRIRSSFGADADVVASHTERDQAGALLFERR